MRKLIVDSVNELIEKLGKQNSEEVFKCLQDQMTFGAGAMLSTEDGVKHIPIQHMILDGEYTEDSLKDPEEEQVE